MDSYEITTIWKYQANLVAS